MTGENPGPARDNPALRRRVALVMLAAIAVWLTGNWLGAALGFPGVWAFALDLGCLAAFGWALAKAIGMMRGGAEH